METTTGMTLISFEMPAVDVMYLATISCVGLLYIVRCQNSPGSHFYVVGIKLLCIASLQKANKLNDKHQITLGRY